MWKNGISQHLKSLIHDNVVNVISDIYKINKSGNVVNLARIDKKRTTTDNEPTLWVAAEGAAGCFDSWACSFIRKICSSSHVTSVSRCCTACTHKQRQRRVTHDNQRQRQRRVTHDVVVSPTTSSCHPRRPTTTTTSCHPRRPTTTSCHPRRP